MAPVGGAAMGGARLWSSTPPARSVATGGAINSEESPFASVLSGSIGGAARAAEGAAGEAEPMVGRRGGGASGTFANASVALLWLVGGRGADGDGERATAGVGRAIGEGGDALAVGFAVAAGAGGVRAFDGADCAPYSASRRAIA